MEGAAVRQAPAYLMGSITDAFSSPPSKSTIVDASMSTLDLGEPVLGAGFSTPPQKAVVMLSSSDFCRKARVSKESGASSSGRSSREVRTHYIHAPDGPTIAHSTLSLCSPTTPQHRMSTEGERHYSPPKRPRGLGSLYPGFFAQRADMPAPAPAAPPPACEPLDTASSSPPLISKAMMGLAKPPNYPTNLVLSFAQQRVDPQHPRSIPQPRSAVGTPKRSVRLATSLAVTPNAYYAPTYARTLATRRDPSAPRPSFELYDEETEREDNDNNDLLENDENGRLSPASSEDMPHATTSGVDRDSIKGGGGGSGSSHSSGDSPPTRMMAALEGPVLMGGGSPSGGIRPQASGPASEPSSRRLSREWLGTGNTSHVVSMRLQNVAASLAL